MPLDCDLVSEVVVIGLGEGGEEVPVGDEEVELDGDSADGE